MLINKKKYKVLRTHLKLIKLFEFLNSGHFLNICNFQHFNSTKFNVFKKSLCSLNLKSIFLNNALFYKNYHNLNVPVFYVRKLFLSNNFFVCSKNKNNVASFEIYSSLHLKFDRSIFLPLFTYSYDKFFYSLNCTNFYNHSNKQTVFVLLSVLYDNYRFIFLLDNILQRYIALFYETLKKNKCSNFIE